MDKRTAFAFLLMFLVLLVWQSVFSPSPNDTGKNPGASSDSLAVAQDEPVSGTRGKDEFTRTTGAAGQESPSAATLPGNAGEENRAEGTSAKEAQSSGSSEFSPSAENDPKGPVLVIDTDHYIAQLDLVGADLRSWVLKDFQTLDGSAVELIPSHTLDSEGQRAHVLRILRGTRILELDRVRFEARGDRLQNTHDPKQPWRLTLDEEHPTGTVTLSASDDAGTPLRIELTVDNREMSIDVHVSYDLPATDLANLEISWPGGISNTEPDTLKEYREFRAAARVGDDTHKVKFGSLEKGDGSKGRKSYEGTIAWAGVMSQYFTSFVHPTERPLGLVHLGGDGARKLQTFSVRLPLATESGPGLDYTVYMGPLDYNRLQEIDPALTEQISLGPTVFRPVSKMMLWLLLLVHRYIPNYGIVIILISVATKFLFYPLTKSSTRSMREMQLVQPELTKLKEKHKNDQSKQSQEMMKLYKEHGINPMAGCLPLLVQMPVFWALFTVLRSTIELRQAPFAWWIQDLSRPDVLFQFPFHLPVIGNHFSLLPLLMAGGMWLQTKIGTPSGAQGGEGAMASQQRMMSTAMPLFMLFIFYNTPSGLVLYWLVNTILTIVQTWEIHRNAPNTLAEKQALAEAKS